jgi:transposase
MDKNAIITMKAKGKSNREVARLAGVNRKTVAQYWSEYQQQVSELGENPTNRELQQLICQEPAYDSSSRGPVKYTPEIDSAIDAILAEEKAKGDALGPTHKQRLSCRQIHERLTGDGYDIGLTTITQHVGEKRRRAKEAFIRQEYDFGKRLEYDFGEVMLLIAGIKGTYHMAALSSPASGHRWAYLYKTQRKEAFLDSHVRFFEQMGGAWEEMVYDNMRNVVSRFIGRKEKELNPDLIKMSNYYGFSINVTNCYRGNEKGHVESSVKHIRNRVFAKRYSFASFEEAAQYLQDELVVLNRESLMEEERLCLLPPRPPLELAHISEQSVDKYSFICVENNFYSVPDHLVGRSVTVKNYLASIDVFCGLDKVCAHEKADGYHQERVDIFHYLKTLERKPGAVRNSKALRTRSALKELFDSRFKDSPRELIALLRKHGDRPDDELVALVKASLTAPSVFVARPRTTLAQSVQQATRRQLKELSSSVMIGGGRHAD